MMRNCRPRKNRYCASSASSLRRGKRIPQKHTKRWPAVTWRKLSGSTQRFFVFEALPVARGSITIPERGAVWSRGLAGLQSSWTPRRAWSASTTGARRHLFAWARSPMASSRARRRSCMDASSTCGPSTGVRSPVRMSRASWRVSRRSVLTRSPACFGIREGATVIGCVEAPALGLDLPLDVRGTAFQQQVWQALRTIPAGLTASYTDIAQHIGALNAVRTERRHHD
jgi:hypothetical protein